MTTTADPLGEDAYGDDGGAAAAGLVQGELFAAPTRVPRAVRRRPVPRTTVQSSLDLDPPPVRVRRRPLGPKWEPFEVLPNDPGP